jgi:hypothetical protein
MKSMQEIKFDEQETTLQRVNSYIELSIDNLWFSLDSLDNKLIASLLANVLLMFYALTTRSSSLLSAVLLSIIISSIVFSSVGVMYPQPKAPMVHRRFYFEDFDEVSIDELNERIFKSHIKLTENLEVCLENKTINLWFSLVGLCVSVFLSCII